ncbi:sporulation protein YqfD [Rossellomorea vietnamensis]|uniref:Sporulation protein YqfD n=1 Tax=Rossellomorea vietnamensis TaxID=218284 RepID=A0A5D4KFG3_9BACI|nr:sporulation protein YqfD [Rossellomorea vietnamensis]TYR75475.1 sporulation protein YqfD [Rossellomorea vietnamensis]
MKNQWITFFTGKVLVKVEGQGIERFINEMTRSKIAVWQVKRMGEQTFTFYLSLNDLHNFRRAVRKFGCRVTFLRGQGSPFLWKRALKNSGFLLGGISFFVMILLLSNMVWGISIKGASPQTQYEIEKQLQEMGIKKGKFQFSIPDVESIQRELSNRMNNITWVGVELKGTTYHFQVVEKNEPETAEEIGARNLVAEQKAVIKEVFVEEGMPMVEVNDHVQKGQLLVSGLIGKEDQEKKEAVSAKGVIRGEVWYITKVELPLETDFEVFSGDEKVKHYISFGKFRLPIWGWGKIDYKKSIDEQDEHKLKFLKWELPLTYTEKTVREKEDVTRKYSRKEAVITAKELARNNLKAELPEDAEVTGEKILHEQIENGKVRLNVHFKVIEDIAVGQPIIQGD